MASKIGVHPAILLTLGSLGVILLMGGAIAYNRHQAAEDAEERAESLEQAQEKAKLAAENAILENVLVWHNKRRWRKS